MNGFLWLAHLHFSVLVYFWVILLYKLKFSTLPVNYSLEIKVAFDLCLSLTVNNYYMYPMNLKIKLITAFKLIIVLLMVTTLQVNCDTCTKLYVYWTSMYFMSYFINPSLYHLVIVYFFLLFIISALDLLDTIKMNWIITNYYQLLLIITNLKEKGHSVNQKLSFFFFQTKNQLSRFWHVQHLYQTSHKLAKMMACIL